MNDMVLRQNILDELEFEPSLNAVNIGVSVENGVVTLTGHVPTYMEKNTAADVVCRVKGVRGIAQDMEVRPVGSHRTADDEIAKRALNILSWSAAIPDGAVQVQVDKGWVVLTGTVEWNYQKIAATDAVRALAGVFDVANNIQVKPHVSSFDVKKRIEDALKRSSRIEPSDIRVTVDDSGKVVLEGHVKVWAERSTAAGAAWSAPGVKAVENLLTIA
ncbi:BON domain-containing protein [Phyllobacterium endophyticum]|uniref:Ornithine aminotransferase n=1 Tax=Phyllobacterium endophyticum TaxID=1149773 RepID=A0A2P7ASD4_9HYPH|nr:BON domain-containing protein [Phyllobacterium endophyticum]MBB3236885.1 osmotically-inducible protein OsmY [Phyllobacterium endophyticum]PSH57135.1 ornithine aminotransferase [Phyllobacterium endophyticum]TYR40416.1 BON domain-containing protein [Phyllobacterium endophyticum]